MCNNKPKYAIMVAASCGRCMVAKKMLTEKGIQYAEVNVRTEEGQSLVKQFDIKAAGTIIDLHAGRVVELNDIK